MFHHHESHFSHRTRQLMASLNVLMPEDYPEKNSIVCLLRDILFKSQKTKKILCGLVENHIRFHNPDDLFKVQKILINIINQKEIKMLSTLEADARKIEQAAHKALKYERDVYECLKQLSVFATSRRKDQNDTKTNLSSHILEINSLIERLDRHGISLPKQWPGDMKQYQDPQALLQRYSNLYKKAKVMGVANAVRFDRYKNFSSKIKQYFVQLKKEINKVAQTIEMNFIGFKNFIQAKLHNDRFEAMGATVRRRCELPQTRPPVLPGEPKELNKERSVNVTKCGINAWEAE